MLIPPIEMPLSAIIHEACRTPLDDDIVRLLCWDLLQALLACKNCGLHFKWLDTAHGNITAALRTAHLALTLTFASLSISCLCDEQCTCRLMDT